MPQRCLVFSVCWTDYLNLAHHAHFPGGSDGKASVCNAGDLGLIPGQEDPLEKEMAIHSSTLAWRIRWTEEPGGLQPMGSHRVGHGWAAFLSLYAHFWLSHIWYYFHPLECPTCFPYNSNPFPPKSITPSLTALTLGVLPFLWFLIGFTVHWQLCYSLLTELAPWDRDCILFWNIFLSALYSNEYFSSIFDSCLLRGRVV